MEYQVGDKVRIVEYSIERGTGCDWINENMGNTFEIVDIDNNDDKMPIRVKFGEDRYHWLWYDEFEVVETEDKKAKMIDMSQEKSVKCYDSIEDYIGEVLDDEITIKEKYGGNFLIIGSAYYSDYHSKYNKDKCLFISNEDSQYILSLEQTKELAEKLNNIVKYYEKYDRNPTIKISRNEMLDDISSLSDEQIKEIWERYNN